MNADERLAVIRAKAGKGRTAIPKPRGMAHPGEAAERRPRFRYEPAKYGLVYGAFGPIRTPPRLAVRLEGDLKEGVCFKEGQRHGAHWLTRVAEKMKRGWHRRHDAG